MLFESKFVIMESEIRRKNVEEAVVYELIYHRLCNFIDVRLSNIALFLARHHISKLPL